jgi:xanthine dehydrogenase YagR molybdenum-binding subunit
VYDKTQGVLNVQRFLMKVFGLTRAQVRVVSPFVGGAFGSALRPQYDLILAMMAARDLKQPVRVTLTRQQMFTLGHRPATVQHVALGARPDGLLDAIVHEAVSGTSQFEDFADVVVNWAGQLYDAPNVQLGYQVAKLDVFTPCDMRAPGATQGFFGLECAMDELAVALDTDPLELRIMNYAQRDANRDLPFSSNALLDCYAQGAERFGWGAREPTPRSMRDGHELIGWGMATGAWDAMQTKASARAVLDANGRLAVSFATSDIGTGTDTAMTQIGADVLKLSPSDVTFSLGDTSLPPAPLEGGSWTVSSVGSAVSAACVQLRSRLAELLQTHGGVAFANLDADALIAFVNPLGAKGVGEIGVVGVAAAIANAVYHATGIRVRELPITLDKVFA